MANAFKHVCYRVGNFERSRAFYLALGLEEQHRYQITDTETKVMFGFAGDAPYLGLTYEAGVDSWELGTGYNHIALIVEELEALLPAVVELGGAVEQQPFRLRHGGSLIAFVRDPDGYRIELIQK